MPTRTAHPKDAATGDSPPPREPCPRTGDLFPEVEHLGTVLAPGLAAAGQERVPVPVTLEKTTTHTGAVFFTPKGPTIGGKDFAKRGNAIRFVKRVYEHPSNGAQWLV